MIINELTFDSYGLLKTIHSGNYPGNEKSIIFYNLAGNEMQL